MAILNQSSSEAALPRQELDLNAVFSALADHRRRYVLRDLVQRFHPVALHDLTSRLVAFERDASDIDETYDEVYAALFETHVPELVEAGLVEFSADDERLSLTERGMDAERVRRAGIEAVADGA